MSAPSGSDSVQNESPVLVDDVHVFHPLSVFESQLLSDDLDLSFGQDNNPPAVLLDDCIYVRDDHLNFRATEGQLWKYSLIDRSLNIIRTPEGVVSCYGLAVLSKKLVLVGGQSNSGHKSSYKVWVRQETRWNCEIIPQVPVKLVELIPTGKILSAAGYEGLLFTMYGWYSYQLKETQIALFSYDTKTARWRRPSKCLQFRGMLNDNVRVNFLVHNASIYAVKHSQRDESMFHFAHISSSSEANFEQLCVSGDVFISERARFTTIGNKVIVADHGRKIKLYTIYKDEKKKLSLVDIDELSVEYQSILSIIGLERSLLVIGREYSKSVITVQKFDSKVSPYNPSGHFTIKAIKKLERAANIPVLTDEGLKSTLGAIKTYCGFKLHDCRDVCQSLVVRYMRSWLAEYQHTCNTSIAEPTWSKLLEALKCVGLPKLEKQIRECLESAPKLEDCKSKEVTGIEELQKIEAKLELLHDHLNSEAVPQRVKKDVDWCYRQCCTASRKIRQEQLAFKSNNDQLAKEKEQLVKENSQLKREMDSLQKKLAERDQPPATRHHLDGEESISGTSEQPLKLTAKHLPSLLKGLKNYAAKWREIGTYLGFLPGELNNIQAHPNLIHGAPVSYLGNMFEEWIQWAPEDSRGSVSFATLDELKAALIDAGLAATAHDLTISSS